MNTPRLFSLEEANATLPYVRRVVRDIVATHRRISDLWDGGDASTRREIRRLLQKRDEYVAELELVGCEFGEIERGLVDFRARVNATEPTTNRESDATSDATSDGAGEVVSLCWRLGEPEILFWHRREQSFRERRPIEELAGRLAAPREATAETKPARTRGRRLVGGRG